MAVKKAKQNKAIEGKGEEKDEVVADVKPGTKLKRCKITGKWTKDGKPENVKESKGTLTAGNSGGLVG